MKRLQLLFLLLSFSTIAFGQGASWTFFTEQKEPFYLYLNNQLINRLPQNQVVVDQLMLKEYLVTIEFKDITLGIVKDDIKVRRNRPEVFVIFKQDESYAIDDYTKAKRGFYQPKSSPELKVADYEGYTGKVSCAKPVDNAKVEALASQLNELTFGDQKMETIRSFVKTNCLAVKQFKLLINTLDFEDNKLNLAKFAYSYIFDRENYYLLHDVFDYPYSVEDLNNFIGKRPK